MYRYMCHICYKQMQLDYLFKTYNTYENVQMPKTDKLWGYILGYVPGDIAKLLLNCVTLGWEGHMSSTAGKSILPSQFP